MSVNVMFKKGKISFEFICLGIAICFISSIVMAGVLQQPIAQNPKSIVQTDPVLLESSLPVPTERLEVSRIHSKPVLRGIKINPDDPFKLEFIIDTEDNKSISKEELSTLIKYFLAALTIPEEDLWVNLSPYEKDRIIPDNLSLTDLGKDLLGQDYLLKQLVSSLMYPDSSVGKKYWDRIYKEVFKLANTTKVPINTFNKTWIVPDKAEVYENGNVVLITEAKLKVLSEEDYLALSLQSQEPIANSKGLRERINSISQQALKETILPELSWDVNHGENFSKLRQMYHSLVLATWFKKKLKDSIYQYYIDQGKTKGIDLKNPDAKEKIYNLYVESFKKGVYDYIKTDYEPSLRKKIKRRYHSGGMGLRVSSALNVTVVNRNAMIKAADDLLTFAPTYLVLPDGESISPKRSSSGLGMDIAQNENNPVRQKELIQQALDKTRSISNDDGFDKMRAVLDVLESSEEISIIDLEWEERIFKQALDIISSITKESHRANAVIAILELGLERNDGTGKSIHINREVGKVIDSLSEGSRLTYNFAMRTALEKEDRTGFTTAISLEKKKERLYGYQEILQKLQEASQSLNDQTKIMILENVIAVSGGMNLPEANRIHVAEQAKRIAMGIKDLAERNKILNLCGQISQSASFSSTKRDFPHSLLSSENMKADEQHSSSSIFNFFRREEQTKGQKEFSDYIKILKEDAFFNFNLNDPYGKEIMKKIGYVSDEFALYYETLRRSLSSEERLSSRWWKEGRYKLHKRAKKVLNGKISLVGWESEVEQEVRLLNESQETLCMAVELHAQEQDNIGDDSWDETSSDLSSAFSEVRRITGDDLLIEQFVWNAWQLRNSRKYGQDYFEKQQWENLLFRLVNDFIEKEDFQNAQRLFDRTMETAEGNVVETGLVSDARNVLEPHGYQQQIQAKNSRKKREKRPLGSFKLHERTKSKSLKRPKVLTDPDDPEKKVSYLIFEDNEPTISSSSLKGGIDLQGTEANMKNVSNLIQFNNISFETIQRLRTSSGLTFKILTIQPGVKMENIVDPEEDKISYLP